MAKAELICQPNSHPFNDRTISLEQAVKIGRSVDRAQATNALFDEVLSVSRNHALLWYEAGKFYLQDTKSKKGTFVNNQRLSKRSEESPPREVCSGDILQFGDDNECIIATLKLYLPEVKFGVQLLENGRVRCEVCDKDFSQLKNARQHFQTIHVTKDKNIPCEKCDKKFSNLRYMKDHMRRIHKISAKMIPSTSKTKMEVKKESEKIDVKEEPMED